MDWVILAHGDCDGVCSASLAYSARRNAQVVFTNPFDLLSELRSLTNSNVIVADIALTPAHKDEIIRELARISATQEVFYFDHHPLPHTLSANDIPGGAVTGEGGSCSSELVYEHFRNQLDPEMSRVAVYGAIGDYSDDTPVIREILRSWDKRELYLEAGILTAALEGTRKKDYDFKRELVRYLSQNKLPSLRRDLVETAVRESEIDERMRHVVRDTARVQGKVAYVKDIQWSLGKAATYARAYMKSPVGVAAEQMKEYVDMSIRSVDLTNLQEIVSSVAQNLGGDGGGHTNSAGARVPNGHFMEFIDGLDRELQDRPSIHRSP